MQRNVLKFIVFLSWFNICGIGVMLTATTAQGEEVVTKVDKEKIAVIETNMGIIEFMFYADVAPGHVENFIKLADQGYYDSLIFHRVVQNFVIQGGCPNGTGSGNPGYSIDAEFNDKPHLTGTVAMARSQNPNSAGSQFYICLRDLPQLDNNYTVFGQVTKGMEVVEAIGQVEVANQRPLQKVIMEKVYIKEE